MSLPLRAHVITGGFPRGSAAGHDHDYARLRILEKLADADVKASVANDFSDVEDWLPISRLLITYTAGPFADVDQAAAIGRWLHEGSHWLGLHGTSGGKAARRSETDHRRTMVKLPHHDVLGGFFLNHPPVRRFNVNVHDGGDALTRDLPVCFEVVDEPYMIEVQHPADSKTLLTAELGPDNSPRGFGFVYDEDTALLPDGKTRVLAYSRDVGAGGVTYIALGHCHDSATNVQPFVDRSVDPDGKTPATLRVTWETPAYQTLLRNCIAWGVASG